MNPLPPNADELVSAYLDGEAAPDEIATVESSPELLGRVETLRALSGRIGEPVSSPPAAQKEAHIAAALDVFDGLLAADAAQAEAPVAATGLAAVPDLDPTNDVPTAPRTPTADSNSTVTSFDDARQKRRPRRFSVGVIAAAIAALAVVAALSFLSFGGSGTDDIASSGVDSASDAADFSTESAPAMAAESGEVASDAMDDEEAMNEEEAMDDEESAVEIESSAADQDESGSRTTSPAPTTAALAAPQEGASVDSDTATIDDEAMDEEALSDDQPPAEIVPFFLGRFETLDDLQSDLTALSSDQVLERKAGVGQGIFTRCQASISELAVEGTATLIGEAGIGQDPREVHLLTTDEGFTFYVVDPADCSVITTFG